MWETVRHRCDKKQPVKFCARTRHVKLLSVAGHEARLVSANGQHASHQHVLDWQRIQMDRSWGSSARSVQPRTPLVTTSTSVLAATQVCATVRTICTTTDGLPWGLRINRPVTIAARRAHALCSMSLQSEAHA
mmetsp:Transcript_45408/g.120421  ORF Transcript_45408/g.120421 Transcript_45408/m.120421 type:complete len:133 (+) Transcript_45408:6-404(+)